MALGSGLSEGAALQLLCRPLPDSVRSTRTALQIWEVFSAWNLVCTAVARLQDGDLNSFAGNECCYQARQVEHAPHILILQLHKHRLCPESRSLWHRSQGPLCPDLQNIKTSRSSHSHHRAGGICFIACADLTGWLSACNPAVEAQLQACAGK